MLKMLETGHIARYETAAWQYYLAVYRIERLVVGWAVIAQWLEHWRLKPVSDLGSIPSNSCLFLLPY